MNRYGAERSGLRAAAHHVLVALSAAGMALALFMSLALMHSVTEPTLAVGPVEYEPPVTEPAPPAPPKVEPPDEPTREDDGTKTPEPPPPVVVIPPLDLNPNADGGNGGVVLPPVVPIVGPGKDPIARPTEGAEREARPIRQPAPRLTDALRRRLPARVALIFIVDERGHVANARVERSTDEAFEAPALAALKRWRFEPAERDGEPVVSRVRMTIRFPKD